MTAQLAPLVRECGRDPVHELTATAGRAILQRQQVETVPCAHNSCAVSCTGEILENETGRVDLRTAIIFEIDQAFI